RDGHGIDRRAHTGTGSQRPPDETGRHAGRPAEPLAGPGGGEAAMSDYWGAHASWPSRPGGDRVGYFPPPPFPDLKFTPPPGDPHAADIEKIYLQVMNQHPEHMSLLADEWHNAYNLLDTVYVRVLEESNALYPAHWTSTAADTFMSTGPGAALAYLDEWKTAALNNRNALRALVDVVIKYRTDM